MLEVEVEGFLEFAEDAFANEHGLVVGDVGGGRRYFEAGQELPVHEDGLVDLQLGKALCDLPLAHELLPQLLLYLPLAVLPLEVPRNRFVVVFEGPEGGSVVPVQLGRAEIYLFYVPVH